MRWWAVLVLFGLVSGCAGPDSSVVTSGPHATAVTTDPSPTGVTSAPPGVSYPNDQRIYSCEQAPGETQVVLTPWQSQPAAKVIADLLVAAGDSPIGAPRYDRYADQTVYQNSTRGIAWAGVNETGQLEGGLYYTSRDWPPRTGTREALEGVLIALGFENMASLNWTDGGAQQELDGHKMSVVSVSGESGGRRTVGFGLLYEFSPGIEVISKDDALQSADDVIRCVADVLGEPEPLRWTMPSEMQRKYNFTSPLSLHVEAGRFALQTAASDESSCARPQGVIWILVDATTGAPLRVTTNPTSCPALP